MGPGSLIENSWFTEHNRILMGVKVLETIIPSTYPAWPRSKKCEDISTEHSRP